MQPLTAFERRAGLEIVDVRDPQEWDAGHIEGSRHIPVGELAARAGELRGDLPVLTVCRTGRRSGRAVETLRSLGIEADHVEGGLAAWSEGGFPLVATGGRPGSLAPVDAGQDHEDGAHERGQLGPGIQRRVMELLGAAQEHFGGREPSEQEARHFFEQLLAAEGRTQEEIDEILS